MDTKNTSDRLTKVETLLGVSLENQDASKERMHRLSNDLQSMSGRLDQIVMKLDAVKELQTEVVDVTKRLDSLEKTRSNVQTAWSLAKWLGGIMGGCFTLALTLSDKIAPLWGMFFK